MAEEAVGLRELRQHVSDLVRRGEAGDEVIITVAGRPAARLVPAAPKQGLDDLVEVVPVTQHA